MAGNEDATQLKHLLGNDPLPGNQAVEYFAAQGSACIPLITGKFVQAAGVYQVRHRIVRLFGMLGDDVAEPLLNMVRYGKWAAQELASECFSNFRHRSNHPAVHELVKLLPNVYGRDTPNAVRAAIMALGYAGAHLWSSEITDITFKDEDNFQDYRLYSLRTLVRFVTTETDENMVENDLSALEAFVRRWKQFNEEHTEARAPFGKEQEHQIYEGFAELTPVAEKKITSRWSEEADPLYRELAALALSRLKLDRTLQHCIRRFLDQTEDLEVRALYALNLGLLDNARAFNILLDTYRQASWSIAKQVRGYSNFYWYTSFALAASLRHIDDRETLDMLLPNFFANGPEVQAQVLYSQGILKHNSEHINESFASDIWLVRAFAAVTLARVAGTSTLAYLKRIASSQVSHEIEDLLTLVSVIYAGDTRKTSELHAKMCMAGSGGPRLIVDDAPSYSPAMEHLRYVLQREILYALAHGGEQGLAQATAWADLMKLNMERVFLEMELLGFSMPHQTPSSPSGLEPLLASNAGEDLTLSKIQVKQLHEALISAFPHLHDLEVFTIHELGVRLPVVATIQANYSYVVQQLIDWAIANGRLRELLQGASNKNSRNARLRALFKSINFVPQSENRGSSAGRDLA